MKSEPPENITSTENPPTESDTARCSACDENHDRWDDGRGGYYCQDCWESHCDEGWNNTVMKLSKANLI